MIRCLHEMMFSMGSQIYLFRCAAAYDPSSCSEESTLVCVCIPILVTTFRHSVSGSVVWNHCRTHLAPCIRPHCVCSVLHAHVQFCRFDKADATAGTAMTDRLSQLRTHWVQISWSIGSKKIIWICSPGGSRTLNFLRARRAPYPLG